MFRKLTNFKLIRQVTHVVGRQFNIETKFDVNGIEIKANNVIKKFPYLWLRDNCKCSKCYNYIADEIDIDLTKLSDSIKPDKVETVKNIISVTWDDGHKSEYNLENFVKNSLMSINESNKELYLWNSELIKTGIPKFSYEQYSKDNLVLKHSLQSIKKYGAAIIEGVKPDEKSITQVCKRIGPIQNSHFGADCIVTNSLSFKDRAYTNLSLKAHTDTVYLKNSAGVEMFHVITPAKVGGESLLVDGFYCAELLRQNHPEDFDLLTKLSVEFNFLKEGAYDFRFKSPVIELDLNGKDLKQIRFNPYHKINLDHLSYQDITGFYKAMRKFTQIIQNKSNELWIGLREDQVLLFDNFRLLHGRASFKGNRKLITVYLSRDDWLSKLNVLEA
ncbi:unnamed protein product [Brachionus calyciflorus]|uniref:Trimethyllysine dioxygenase, mitochondrial n=1 Tax=Brachionus calyciflorus TaxID=104777 RepID=A0A813QGJ5_9BILA|nr:unnamed protein product [Brachionus calyciflorus]